MKLFLALSLISSVALAVPKGYSYGGPASLARGKDNCICLETSQESTADGGVTGVYSYVDPIGSTITVTYVNGPEGYSEKRRITKSKDVKFTTFRQEHQTTGTTTTTTVSYFTSFVTRITPLIRDAISYVVAEFEVLPLEKITSELETSLMSHVLSVVEKKIGEQGVDVNVRQVAQNVIQRISVLIFNEVQSHFDEDRIVFPGNVNHQEIVSRVIDQLEVIIQEAIDNPYFVPAVNEQVSIVQEEISAPIVADVVTQVETETTEILGASRPNAQDIIAKVLAALRPAIVQAVRDHTTTSQVVTTQTQTQKRPAQVQHTVVNKRPVQNQQKKTVTTTTTTTTSQKQQAVNRPAFQQTTTTTEEFSKDLVTDIVFKLQNVIASHVKRVFDAPATTRLGNIVIADSITDGMRSNILTVIRQVTAGDASYNDAKVQRLHKRLVSAIRPVILRAINQYRLIQVQKIETTVLSDSFIQSIVDGILGGIETIITEVINANPGATEEQLIQLIIRQLNLRNRISGAANGKELVITEEFYTSETYNTLVQRITAALRPIILEEIAQYRLIQVQRIETTILSNSFIESIVNNILGGIETIVFEIISSNPGATDQQLIQMIISQFDLGSQISGAVTSQGLSVAGDFYTSETYNTLVQKIMTELRTLIPGYITTARQNQSKIITTVTKSIIDSNPSLLEPAIRTILESYTTNSDEEIFQEVISVLSVPIRQEIQVTMQLYGYAGNGAAYTSMIDYFYKQVVSGLRSHIMNEIVRIRNSLRPKPVATRPPVRQVQKQTTHTKTVTGVFGISGENTVAVQTPTFQYAYETEHK